MDIAKEITFFTFITSLYINIFMPHYDVPDLRIYTIIFKRLYDKFTCK